jgi:3-mercaptopyruvate sulfurtransferase SseA
MSVSGLFAGAASAAGGGVETYQSLLVPVEWVMANLENVVLVDARANALYKGQQGHLPGAVNAEWTYFVNMHGNPGDPTYGAVRPHEEMVKRIGALGIDGTKDVVVYGDGGDWGNAGFVVWILRMSGMRNARIMDGGFSLYRASGGVTTDKSPTVKEVAFNGTFDGSYIVDHAWMRENFNNPDVKIVDVRSFEEYTGQIRPFGERRPGHIPGATSMPWVNVNPRENDFKVLPEGQLTAFFEAAGFTDKNQTIICYDTSGVRGGFMTMIFRLAGYPNVRSFNPAFQVWSADAEVDVVQGPNPF